MKINRQKKLIYWPLLSLFLLAGCNGNMVTKKEVHVKNTLDFNRISETVSIPMAKLSDLTAKYSPKDLLVLDPSSGNYLVRQLIDENQDGQPDELLFQVSIKANEEKTYQIIGRENGAEEQPHSKYTTFSRFVPERIDDYAWENDKVAFRTFGPKAQQLTEEHKPGGTLTSGIDLWFKRVKYPIIDEWYAGAVDSVDYYNVDRGEGCDAYHVGSSRGDGGIGVWQDDSLHVSKNFVSYKTIARGPIRTVFELTYAPWSEYRIQETKRISLDLGSNFSKFVVSLKPEKPVPNITIGISMHERKGDVKLEPKEGWFRQWEKGADSFVGEGVVVNSARVDSAFTHISPTPDQSQIMVVTQPKDSVLTYYAGFAWVKSGQVKSVEGWDAMLQKQAERILHPLEVTIQ